MSAGRVLSAAHCVLLYCTHTVLYMYCIVVCSTMSSLHLRFFSTFHRYHTISAPISYVSITCAPSVARGPPSFACVMLIHGIPASPWQSLRRTCSTCSKSSKDCSNPWRLSQYSRITFPDDYAIIDNHPAISNLVLTNSGLRLQRKGAGKAIIANAGTNIWNKSE